MLLTRLDALQRSDYVRKTDARKRFELPKYVAGQDIYTYHAEWDDVIIDLTERHSVPDEETLIYDYKQKMDSKVIFDVQRTDRPVTLEDWRDAVENYFDDAQGLITGPGKVLGGAKMSKLDVQPVDSDIDDGSSS